MNCFCRHYICNPAMTANGVQAGGIVGFLNAIKYLSSHYLPSKIFVIWEGGGSKRRRDIFPDYKSNRKPPRLNRYYEGDIPDTPENRIYQIKVLLDTLKFAPVCQIYIDDCEADDVIGYLCKNTLKYDTKIIASSDKDFYQLIDEKTTQFSWTTKTIIDEAAVLKEYNIAPHNFAVAKTFNGDQSDNIPGIKGVGFKTLAKRFPALSSKTQMTILDIINESKDQIHTSLKIYSRINDNINLIKRNWKIMYLDASNLAAVQIRKIDTAVDTFEPKKNKMKLMRKLIDEGLGTYDALAFFSSFMTL